MKIQEEGYDPRETLLYGVSKAQETSGRLTNAHRIAAETENIGTDVINDLASQRRTLEKARDNVRYRFYPFS